MTNRIAETGTEKISVKLPLRCSVCGKKFLDIYPNTLPGIVFATCCSGHKTSYRTGAPEASRKAV